METPDKNLELKSELMNKQYSNNWLYLMVILFVGWMIAMSIIIAGWIISKQINDTKNTPAIGQQAQEPVQTSPIQVELNDTFPTLGNPDAKVTVIEFADFQCPFCSQWQKSIFPLLKSEYIDTGKIKFAYFDFAFLGPESEQAAEASSCALDQGKFWEYHDKLFDNQGGENIGVFSDDKLKLFASELNLNTTQFDRCLSEDTHAAQVTSKLQQASKYGIDSTPTVLINGWKYSGVSPWSQYKQAIEKELNK